MQHWNITQLSKLYGKLYLKVSKSAEVSVLTIKQIDMLMSICTVFMHVDEYLPPTTSYINDGRVFFRTASSST